jgi:hypothetical protein
MTPIEMHYSWFGFVYQATAWFGQRLAEKWFDVVLALIGTLFGYCLAKRHLERFVSGIVEKMDAKYLDLNRQIAFRRAVTAMLPELPRFYMRPTRTFSPQVASAIAEFTSWSTAIDSTHTPEKSLELVSGEAYTTAAGLIAKDMGFREAASVPCYEWEVAIGGLPVGWKVEESPDISIFDWEKGAPVYRHALMEEVERTANSIRYRWRWDIAHVPCGVYVGVVNFKIAGKTTTAGTVGDRVRIFLNRENGLLTKAHGKIPWDDKPADTK